MPKTQFQGFVFTVLMVTFMVFTMTCYNISLATKELSLNVLKLSLFQLPLFFPIAFIIDYFFVGKFAKMATAKTVGKNPKVVAIILAMATFSILWMCPIMSGIATIYMKGYDVNFYSLWLKTILINLPFAFFIQLVVVGPIVRFIFSLLFRNKEKKTEVINEDN